MDEEAAEAAKEKELEKLQAAARARAKDKKRAIISTDDRDAVKTHAREIRKAGLLDEAAEY